MSENDKKESEGQNKPSGSESELKDLLFVLRGFKVNVEKNRKNENSANRLSDDYLDGRIDGLNDAIRDIIKRLNG